MKTLFQKDKVICRKCCYFLLLLIFLLPILYFPIKSLFYYEITQSPHIENGVLDLAGFDFDDKNLVYLAGEWEFYWQKWIVTDEEAGAQPSAMLSVPRPWKTLKMDGEFLPNNGYASYRIQIKNAPENARIISYVPNLGASYRVFLNRQLVSASGEMSKTPSDQNISLSLARNWINSPIEQADELVIELSCYYSGGLVLTPVLADSDYSYIDSHIRDIISCIVIGILIVSIGGNAYTALLKDPSFHTAALFVLDLMMFLRFLGKNEFFALLKTFFPFLKYYMVNNILQVATSFLPVVFLICTYEFIQTGINRKELLKIICFESVCCVFMLLCLLFQYPFYSYIFCLISFLPFISIFKKLYHSVTKGVPYSLVVLSEMLLMFSALIISSEYSTGILIENISLFPLGSFVLAVLIQDYMYIKKNQDMRQEALEAVSLRLRLKESQTALMLSQIKPHFLYNALIAIQVLCSREPETAEAAIMNFARYLRTNMQFINSPAPILFSKELEHIKNYTAIEKLRFNDRLTIQYEIGPDQFLLPPLSVQPLVENAIKHGACKNMNGGTVLLSTFETDSSFCVMVKDNGPGFDTAILSNTDNESYGLKNIFFRLRQVVSAEINITSALGEGCEVVIKIPKKKTDEGSKL